MKTAAFALALLTSVVQTVGWVECCCILICKHHNDPCEDQCKDTQAEPAPAADCCTKDQEKTDTHEQRCSHVEPSSEVVHVSADLPSLPVLVLDLPVVPFAGAFPVYGKRDGSFCRSRGSPPLHLLYSVLLI